MSRTENLLVRLSLTRSAFKLEVNLTLPSNGITVLFGQSGSGKTTLLRCVAGLEKPQHGFISIGQQIWQDDSRGTFAQTWQRDLGYVFQEASLFEHLNVEQNLGYGLKRSKKAGGAQALTDAITLLGISHLMQRHPQSLSGGERQRVAIARALATQPSLLLLDEPLAALDIARRDEILPWLEKMRDELNIPMLYVTHSAEEVARLANHLVVLENGRVRADGVAQDVLARVNSPIIIGEDAGVLLNGRVVERDLKWHLSQIAFPGGLLWVRDNMIPIGQEVRLRVLARDVSITTKENHDTSIQNHLFGKIEAIVQDTHPSQCLVRIACGDSVLLARVTKRAIDSLNLEQGQGVWAQVKSVAVI